MEQDPSIMRGCLQDRHKKILVNCEVQSTDCYLRSAIHRLAQSSWNTRTTEFFITSQINFSKRTGMYLEHKTSEFNNEHSICKDTYGIHIICNLHIPVLSITLQYKYAPPNLFECPDFVYLNLILIKCVNLQRKQRIFS